MSAGMEAPNTCPRLAACATRWRQLSLLAMIHMRCHRGRWTLEHRLHTVCAPLCQWFASLDDRLVLELGRGQKVKVRPRPLVKANRREEKVRPDKTSICIKVAADVNFVLGIIRYL